MKTHTRTCKQTEGETTLGRDLLRAITTHTLTHVHEDRGKRYLGRDILRGVEDGVHGVDLGEGQGAPVGEFARLGKLTQLQGLGEDAEGGHLHQERQAQPPPLRC